MAIDDDDAALVTTLDSNKETQEEDEEFEDIFAWEDVGDGIDFDLSRDRNTPYFAPDVIAGSYCAFPKGDAKCLSYGFNPVQIVDGSDTTRMYCWDQKDDTWALVRERGSALEIEQFRQLIKRYNIHPNCLPSNIH